MSESCPKCGSPRTQFEGQTSWECGSYQSLIGGSHIRNPAFKLIESEHCLCRTALAAATKRAEEAEATVNLYQIELRLAGEEQLRRSEEHARELQGCRDLIATLRTRIAESEQDLNAGREYMRKAWYEMNAIRARDGAPAGVCHEYWSGLVDQLGELLGDDAKPWMTGASLRERNKLTAAEQENIRLREAAAELIDCCNSLIRQPNNADYECDAREAIERLAALLAKPEGGK